MFALWLACTPPPGEVDSGSAPVDSTSSPEGLEPSWDVHEASAALREVIALGLPTREAICDPYLELVRAGDEGCPNAPDDQFPEGRVPLEGCTTQDGTYYVGLSHFEEQGESFRLWGDFRIERADGARMEIGGEQGFDGMTMRVNGSFLDQAGSGWLERGLGATLVLQRTDEQTLLRGGLASLRGDEAVWYELYLQGDCASGEIRTRDEAGGWYTFTLEDCDCGLITFAGEEIGRSCLDLDGLRAAAG